MTDTATPENTASPEVQVDEKATLQARLKQMNIPFHPNAGVEKLKGLLADALTGNEPKQTEAPAAAEAVAEGVDIGEEKPLTDAQKRVRMKKEGLALVRVRITCMNPSKKDWEGELFTVANSFISVKRFVPFNAEDGWHVERILLNAIRDRKYQAFVKKKTKGGVTHVQPKLVPEFAIEELDPLTEDELEELARQQAMSGSIE
ncbi:MAG: hypothetical protein ACRBB6_04205 [Neptuniibacter sp.]